MSASIDQRIVEMQFDNKGFESNVKTSLGTLDKLKKALKFEKAADGLDNINKASKALTFDGIQNGIETVTQKFSALEIMGVTALVNLTNSAVNMGKKLVSSLTIDQATSGWEKYEQKTQAVQTIMSATREQFASEAQQIGVVNEQLEKLNWFTDETSYNFVDMVDNIGKFTSNNIKLDKAVTSMQGIATWAALSGANAQKASQAMYNLAQAMGTGSLQVIDWKSIENANMATAEFKKVAIETAVELGTLKKAADGTFKTLDGKASVSVATFRDTLNKKWLSNDVLTATLKKYGDFTDKLYKLSDETQLTATELLESLDQFKKGTADIEDISERTGVSVDSLNASFKELSDSGFELGERGFRAAQEAKTFAEVIDATKDAVSSKWAKTFEIIFGDYNEAKVLFTGLANLFYDIFAASGDTRNEILAFWKSLGGREALFDGIANGFLAIQRIIEPIKAGFQEIFPTKYAKEWGEILANLSKKFRDFTASWGLTEEAASNLKDLFAGFFSILKLVGGVIGEIFKSVLPIAGPINSILTIIIRLLGYIGRLTKTATQAIDKAEVAQKIIRGICNVLVTFVGLIALAIVKLYDLGVVIKNMQIVKNLDSFFHISDGVNYALDKVKNGIKAITTYIKELRSGKSISEIYQQSLSKINKTLNESNNFILKFFRSIRDGKPVLESIKEAFGSIGERFKELKDNAIEFVQNGMNSFLEQFGLSLDDVKNRITLVVEKIKEFTKQLTPGKLVVLAYVAAILSFVGAMNKMLASMTGLADGATGLFKTLTKAVKKVNNQGTFVKNMAESFALIAASLYLLTKAGNVDDLQKVMIIMAEMIGVMTVFGGIMTGMAALFKKFNFKDTMEGIGKAMLMFSTSVLILVGALKGLEYVSLSGGKLWSAVLVIGAIALELAIAAGIMGKIGPGLLGGGLTLLAFALLLKTVFGALESIKDIDYEMLKTTLPGIFGLILATSVLAAGAANVGITSALGLLGIILIWKKFGAELTDFVDKSGIGAAVKKFVESITEFIKGIDSEKIKEGIKNHYVMIDFLMLFAAGLTYAVGILLKGLSKAGSTMLLLGATLLIMVQVAKQVDELSKSNSWEKGRNFIYTMMVFFTAFAAISSVIKDTDIKHFGKTAIGIAVAINLLALAAHALSVIKWTSLLKAGIAIGGLMAAFIMLADISSQTKDAKTGVITAFVVGLIALSGVLITLTFIPWNELLVAAGSLTLVMMAFGKAIEISTSNKVGKEAYKTLAAMGAAIALLGGVIWLLSKQDWKGVIAATGSMIIAIAALTLAMSEISSLSGFTKWQKSLNIVAMGVTIYLIGQALRAIQNEDWRVMAVSALAMGGCLLAVAATMKIIENTSFKDGAAFAASMVLVSGGLIALSFAIKQFTDIKWETLGKAGATLGTVAVVLAAIGALAGFLPPAAAGMAIFGGVLDLVALAMIGFGYAAGLFAKALADMTPSLQTLSTLPLASIGAGFTSIAGGATLLGLAGLVLIVGAAGVVAMAGALELFTPALMTAAGGITAAIAMIKTAFGFGFKDIGKETKKAGQDGVQGLINGLQDSGKLSLLQRASSALANIGFFNPFKKVTGWHSPWSTMMDAGRDAINGLKEGLSNGQGISTLKTAAANLGTGIKDAATGAFSKLPAELQNILSGAFGALGSQLGGFEEVFGRSLTDPLEEVSEAMEEAGVSTDGFTDALGGVGGAAAQAKSPLEELSDTISGQMDLFSEFNKQTDLTADKLLSNMESQINGITEWANQIDILAERGIDKGLLQKLAEMGPQGYQYTSAFVNMTAEQLGRANELYGQSLTLPNSTASQILGSYKKTGNDIAAGLTSGINANAWKVNDATLKMATDSRQAFEDEYGIASPSRVMQENGVHIITGLCRGIDATKSLLRSTMQRLANESISTFKWIFNYNTFYELGQQAGNGLGNGLSSKMDWVASQARALAQSAVNSAKAALQVHSPSRVFYEIGGFVSKGLANGIAAFSNLAANSSEDMANKTVSKMQNAINTIASVFETDLDYEPTITPVLDLSEIQNGAGRINGIFSKGINTARVNASYVGGLFNANRSTPSEVVQTPNNNNSTVMNFTQNNYSPKSLSRTEIYRQTRNQFAQAKGLVQGT